MPGKTHEPLIFPPKNKIKLLHPLQIQKTPCSTRFAPRASTYPEMGELLEHQRVVLCQAAAVAATALAVHIILDAQRQGRRAMMV
jgi:hypothetical protein